MKLRFWLVLSFIFHFTLAFLFARSQGTETNESATEYLDLTVLPSGSFSTAAAKVVKINIPAKAEHALVPNDISNSNKLSDSTTAAPASTVSTSSTEESAGLVAGIGDGDATSLSDVTRLPRVKKEVKAQYPEEAKIARADGPVVLEVFIDKLGKVQNVKILQGQAHGLDEAATAALRAFEFQPAFKGNEPVAVKIQYTYRFKLGIN